MSTRRGHGRLREEITLLRRVLKAGSLTLSLAAAALVFGPASAQASPQADQVLALVNAHRVQAGCVPLVQNGHLQIAAQKHSAEMASLSRFSHRGVNGFNSQQRASAAGYGARVVENIAAGQQGPREVVADWMASPGHRRNILNCNARSTGIGIAEGGRYGVYWTQKFGGPRV